MFNSIISGTNSKQIMNRLIVLAVLLPSVSVFAEPSVAPVNQATQATSVNQQTTSPQAVGSYKAVNRKQSAASKSVNSRPFSTQRVFKDDYERHLVGVTKSHQTQMVWLSQLNRTEKPNLRKIIWLNQKNRAE